MVTDKLTKADWVKAGLRALSGSGAGALKADSLARELKVSRGSFYWHFTDVSAFCDEVLDAWAQTATESVIARVEAGGGTPLEKLRRLAELVFAGDGALERQVRAWASQSERAARMQEEVDLRRIEYVRSLVVSNGCPQKSADLRSRFLYLALVGHFATVRRWKLNSGELDMIINLVLSNPLDSAESHP